MHTSRSHSRAKQQSRRLPVLGAAVVLIVPLLAGSAAEAQQACCYDNGTCEVINPVICSLERAEIFFQKSAANYSTELTTNCLRTFYERNTALAGISKEAGKRGQEAGRQMART